MKSNSRRRLGALATVGVLAAGLGGLGTLAGYTDKDMVTDNRFSAGFLDLSINPGSAVLIAENMAPGDEVSNSVTVTNDGIFPLTYTVTLSQPADSGILAEVLDVSVHAADEAGSATEDNRLLHQEGLPDLEAVSASEVERFLEPGESEPLFLHAGMLISAGSEYADQHAELHFTFNAVQAPDSIFRVLASDEDLNVRVALATNPVAPAKYVSELLPFEDQSVNYDVLYASNLSRAALEAIAPLSEWGPPEAVYYGTNEPMLRWAAERGESWRRTVLTNTGAPADLRQQILDEYLDLLRAGTAEPAERSAILSSIRTGFMPVDDVVALLEDGLLSADERAVAIRQTDEIPSSYVDAEIWRVLTTEAGYYDVNADLTDLGAHPSATIDLDLLQDLYDYNLPEVEDAIGFSAYLGQDLAQGYALNPSLTAADVEALRAMSHGGWDDKDPALTLMFNPNTPETVLHEIVTEGDFSQIEWPDTFEYRVQGWGANENVSSRVVDAVLALGSERIYWQVLASPNSVDRHGDFAPPHPAAQIIANSGTPTDEFVASYLEMDLWNIYMLQPNPNVTPEQTDLIALILADAPSSLSTFAKDRAFSPQTVAELLETPAGRMGLAGGIQVPPEVLREMAESEDVQQRLAAAGSPSLRSMDY